MDGLRAAFLLRPRESSSTARPLPLLLTVAAVVLLHLGLTRLEVDGPALFDLHGWLAPWWSAGASALVVWALLWREPGSAPARRGPAAFMVLWWIASVPLLLIGTGLSALQERDGLPAWLQSPGTAWALFGLLFAWAVAVPVVLGLRSGLSRPRLATFAVAVVALHGVELWYFNDTAWEAVPPPRAERPRFELSQENFEAQQAVWDRTVAALPASEPGDPPQVWGIVFSPYSREDVFLRENHLVADLLRDRFAAPGHVVQLANHATTSDTLAWATKPNLVRTIEAVADRMDRDRDVLVVYLTSHGASDFKLAASHWPLTVAPIEPLDLRRALDLAGVRHRVIAISACYSGGWIDPLADDHTLVMTAADADHTSYGCGTKSELTFFGRAVFGEALRKTRSFEQAFAAAVPVIKRREEEAGKPDGFSNPQIRVGAAIRPVLDGLAARLDQAAAAR